MGSKLFNRLIVVSLIITKDNESKILTLDGSNLHIGFKAKISANSDSDNGEIYIYNLSNEKRNLLNADIVGHTQIEIYAGYIESGSVSKLYSGYLVEAKSIRESGSIKTVLVFNDSFNEEVNPDDAISFKKGTSNTQVVDKKISDRKEGKNPINVDGEFVSKSSAKVVFDKGTYAEFSEYLRSNNFTVIQRDGIRFIVDKDGYRTNATYQKVHIINEDSGMIGIPEQVTEIEEVESLSDIDGEDVGDLIKGGINLSDIPQLSSNNSKAGYKITTLLNIEVNLGDIVELSSKILGIKNLRLRCDCIEYQCTNYSNDYYSKLKCFPIGDNE
jgi:hypothetical protein